MTATQVLPPLPHSCVQKRCKCHQKLSSYLRFCPHLPCACQQASRAIFPICFSKPTFSYYFKRVHAWMLVSDGFICCTSAVLHQVAENLLSFEPSQGTQMVPDLGLVLLPTVKPFSTGTQSWQSKWLKTSSNLVWFSDTLNFLGRAAKLKSELVQRRELWKGWHRLSNFTLKVKVNSLLPIIHHENDVETIILIASSAMLQYHGPFCDAEVRNQGLACIRQVSTTEWHLQPGTQTLMSAKDGTVGPQQA